MVAITDFLFLRAPHGADGCVAKLGIGDVFKALEVKEKTPVFLLLGDGAIVDANIERQLVLGSTARKLDFGPSLKNGVLHSHCRDFAAPPLVVLLASLRNLSRR